MHLQLRYLALALVSIVSLHYLVSYSSTSYQHRIQDLQSSWSSTTTTTSSVSSLSSNHDSIPSTTPKANATFFVLCRERELNEILWSIYWLENTFNDRPGNHYPYVFLNNEPFTEQFKLRIRRAISSTVEFGQVPPSMWDIPSHIDMEKAHAAWARMAKSGMPYGDSASYRQMCRFQSGFFFRHPLLQKYKYYWRVEPNVKFPCDLDTYDPFRYMEQNGKKYGWVIAMHEIPGTVKTLWIHVRNWYEKFPHFLAQDNLVNFVTRDGGRGYSKCHFWSNFEIADMDFYRSEAYISFFQHLDQVGGFFYERWGDAPVHSIGASLLLQKKDFHWFENVGYFHAPMLHCPKLPKENALTPNTGRSRCYCAHETSFDFDDGHNSCLYEYIDILGGNSTQAKIEFNKMDI